MPRPPDPVRGPRTLLRIVAIGAFLGTATAGAAVAAAAPVAAPLRAAEWQADIDSLDASLRRIHPRPFRRVSEAAYAARLRAIRADAGRVDDRVTTVQLMHLIGSLGDGHTGLLPSARLGFDRWFPVRFYRFDDGLYVIAAAPEDSGLLRARVETIGGRPAPDVADSVATLRGADNALGRMEAVHLLSSGPALHALGLIPHADSLALTVTTPGGARRSLTLAARRSRWDLDWRFLGDVAGPPLPPVDTLQTAFGRPAILPAFRRCDGALPPFLDCRRRYWFTLLPQQRTGYMQMNFTFDDSSEPFRDFVARRFAQMDSAGVDRFVLDLRFNSGGNGDMVMPLVHALIKREEFFTRPGTFYVLVGRQTYSAAMSLIGHLVQHTAPIFVGEPAGSPLNNYGDPISIPLAATGMVLDVSQRYWQFALSDDESRTIPVAIPAVFRAEECFAGRDPALDAIHSSGPEARRVTEVLERDGAAAARTLLETQRERYARFGWWVPWELRDMRRLGERLLEAGPRKTRCLPSRRTRGNTRSPGGYGKGSARAGPRRETCAARARPTSAP